MYRPSFFPHFPHFWIFMESKFSANQRLESCSFRTDNYNSYSTAEWVAGGPQCRLRICWPLTPSTRPRTLRALLRTGNL